MGGGGGPVAIQGGRGPTLGGIQPIGQSSTIISPAVSSSGPHKPQIAASSSVKSQIAQSSSAVTTTGHTPSQQEMGKQTHIQTQPSSMYAQNQSRSASQVISKSTNLELNIHFKRIFVLAMNQTLSTIAG